jgi:hypothetical protein
MRMFSGQLVKPLELRVEDVRLDDICYALGNICRYGGHCHAHYGVAEHTLDVMDRVRSAGGDETEELFAGLHDAGEAYVGDVPHPIKAELGIPPIEDRIQKVIATAFGLDYDAFKRSIEEGIVKYCDKAAGDEERSWLWSTTASTRVANPRHHARQLFRRISRLLVARPSSTEEQLNRLGVLTFKL